MTGAQLKPATSPAMTINGQAVAGETTVEVINPATGRVFAAAPTCNRDQLDHAFAAAAQAQPGWARDDEARAATLHNLAGALRRGAAELAPELVAEQGTPLAEARREIEGAAAWLDYYAGLTLPRTVLRDDEIAHVELVARPIGVVAAITPWNFPLLLASWKIGPALAAGNTMVHKPSPFTPPSTLRMAELMNTALPPGVLNVVTGPGELGSWMTAHPVPRKVSFTGSIDTGKRIAAAVAGDLKRVTLELGGNDPAILLDDADPGVVADGIFAAAFLNAGQVCCAIKRVYAPWALAGELVEALAARAAAIQVGDGMEPGTEMGPINNLPQLQRVAAYTEQAPTTGARAAAGGRPIDCDGYFFAPTILAEARDEMLVVDEEQFGPVLPVLAYDSLEETIAHVHSSAHGLCASAWGTDEDRATKVAARIDCGTAWVNTHAANAPSQPFGGLRWSGIGVENGTAGLAGFYQHQVIHRRKRPTSATGDKR